MVPAGGARRPSGLDEQRRVTVTIEEGATETAIGEQLFAEGLISSRDRVPVRGHHRRPRGDDRRRHVRPVADAAPSQIVAALQGQEFGPTTDVTIQEGLRLEEVVATFAASEMTMNIEEFAAILQAPPAGLLNQFDYLADLPAGRSLEGYILPETLRVPDRRAERHAEVRGPAAADRVRERAHRRDLRRRSRRRGSRSTRR